LAIDGHRLMRVFVPATLPMLTDLHRTGLLKVSDGSAYAVTAALRQWYVEGDAEELEYAALTEAARASLGLLAANPSAPPRRAVVVALDTTEAVPDPAIGRAGVRLSGSARVDQVASVHIDASDAEETVRAAIEAYAAADAGDAEAAITVEEPEGFELLWYATQELPDLLHT
jgi:hypothetical protein